MSTNSTHKNQLVRIFALNGVALCAAMTCFATPSVSADRPFSFRDAEYYMDDDDAMTSAQAFVAGQLPVGLAKAEAAARLTRAGLDCGRPKSADALTCSFGSMADTWTVRLTLDRQGEVSGASVDHKIIGWSGN